MPEIFLSEHKRKRIPKNFHLDKTGHLQRIESQSRTGLLITNTTGKRKMSNGISSSNG